MEPCCSCLCLFPFRCKSIVLSTAEQHILVLNPSDSLKQPAVSQEILHWPHQNSAGLPTRAAAFTQNSRDAPPSRAKLRTLILAPWNIITGSNSLTLLLGRDEKLVLLDSINESHSRKQTWKVYIKLCNFCNHMSTLRDFMAHWIHFIYHSNTGPLTQAAICCRIWLGYFE